MKALIILQKKIFVALLLVAVFVSCYGQNKTQKITGKPKTGTSGNTKLVKKSGTNKYQNVCCGLQDKAGNLWFGTSADGVYRYDGKYFTNYTTKDGLPGNTVSSILEDKAGNLWFGSEAGICRYDGKTFTLVPIFVNNVSNLYSTILPANNPSIRITPSKMMLDKSGKIWVGTSQGVYCYNGKYFIHFLDNDGVINKNKLQLRMVQSMVEDRNGNIWFTTWFEGICRYDGKSITNFKPNGEVWYAGMLEDKNGNIWVGRRSYGLCRYDPAAQGNGAVTFTNVLQHGVLDSCCVYSIIQDKAGNIWFGSEADDMTKRESEGGAWRYDGKTFKNFTTADGLSDYAVFSILEDKTGNIWFCTRNTGLCRYDGKTITNFSK